MNLIDQDSKVFGLDVDADAIKEGEVLAQNDSRFQMIYSNFTHLKHVWNRLRIDKIDGILFDFGVSSPQFDQEDRGFSYHSNAKLDMRLDKTQQLTAYDVVNKASLVELTNIFK